MLMRNILLAGLAWTGCVVAASAVSLDGSWRLDYRDEESKGEWRSVPATVPGDTYLALQEAGVVPDLTKGTNVWSMFGYEQCEWRYLRKFDAPKVEPGERLQLRFDGVDTRATYYLNGGRLGASANMHVPVRFDVTDRVKATDNELVVAIASPLGCDLLPVPGRTREGGTDVEGVRKAMHMFGWDIMPRLVSSGIWRSVGLDVLPPERFGDVHWMTFEADPTNRTARIRVDCQILAPRRHLHKAKLRLALKRNGKVAWQKEHVVRFYQTIDTATLTDVDLWWPRGSGDATLYDASAEFIGEDGTVLAHDVRKFGLRTVRLERADWHSEEDPGTFRFIVNGEPVFMHGCDWSPLDALHSRDMRHLHKACEMLTDLNCNMVRMWGGGVYEPDAFFDFCDANGILVWQDFAMGNVNPPQNDDFAAEIYHEAKSLILRLRSHPSLAIWCANNEIDRAIGGAMAPFAPDPNAERVSREILPRVLREFDPLRPYLPSSPYWSPDVVAGKAKLSQDHIWCWKFGRDPEFTASTVTFVSEMGRHGCPNLESLKKMMDPDCVYPWPDPKDPDHFNVEWNCKCTRAYPDYPEWSGDGRNAALIRGCRNYYGTVPTNLTDFVAASQFVQANELKTWIELYRSRKGRMWGVLWWNLRDGWPIISDGVVDWYFGRKRAYYAIRESQRPQLVCAVYDPQLKAVAVNDARHPVRGKATFTDAATGKFVLSKSFEIAPNGKVELGDLAVEGQGALAINYEIDGKPFRNYFIYGEPPFDFKQVKEWMK